MADQDWTSMVLSQMSEEEKAKLPAHAKQTPAPTDDLSAQVLAQMSPEEKAKLPAFAPKEKDKPKPKDDSGWEDVLPQALASAGTLASQFTPLRATGPVGRVTTAGAFGAAGEGYRQLVKHGKELAPKSWGGGGAIGDVVNLALNPETRAATWEGFKQGAEEGKNRAVTQAGKQALIQGAGEVVGAGLPAVAGGMRMINASPVARNYGLTWKNLVTGLGALAGGKAGGGMGVGGGAIAGRMAGSPQSFNAVTALLDQAGKRLPIADLLRGLDAYRNRPGQEEEP